MYQYTESGLDNVWLKNGYTIEEIEGYGQTVSIDDIEGLHIAIGKRICSSGFITGDEFRFLRKEMDFSQRAFGELLDVSDQAVAIWEKRSAIPKHAVAFIKSLYLERLNQPFKVEHIFSKTGGAAANQKMEFIEQSGRWLDAA